VFTWVPFRAAQRPFATVFADSWNVTLDAIGQRWRQNVPLTPARRGVIP
jgi:hypothetical protein